MRKVRHMVFESGDDATLLSQWRKWEIHASKRASRYSYLPGRSSADFLYLRSDGGCGKHVGNVSWIDKLSVHPNPYKLIGICQWWSSWRNQGTDANIVGVPVVSGEKDVSSQDQRIMLGEILFSAFAVSNIRKVEPRLSHCTNSQDGNTVRLQTRP